jgi:hypothetical protein
VNGHGLGKSRLPYGPRSERTARLLNQLEFTLEELESAAIEDELAAEIASAKTKNTTMTVASFTRQRPSRQPFPDHLPRERLCRGLWLASVATAEPLRIPNQRPRAFPRAAFPWMKRIWLSRYSNTPYFYGQFG